MPEKTLWPIDNLHNWEQNPRSITKDDFARLKKQIQKHGVFKPLVITEDGTVLGGNMRLRAMRELGHTDVWVSIVEAPDEKTKLEYALADNDRAGSYDEQALAELVTAAPDIELDDYKVDLGEPVDLSTLLAKFGPESEVQEDEVPEPPAEAKSKLGEVYRLGRHRLMCGDATKLEDVERLMGGAKADMVFTDPPYALFGNSTGVAGVADDKMIRPFFLSIFQNYKRIMKLFGHMYVCCDWHSAFVLQDMARSVGWRERNLCIWDKGDGGVGAFYQNCYEMIWLYSNSPQSKTTGTKEKGERTINGRPNIWRFNRANQDRVHNAQKPVDMVTNAIQASSDEESVVVDLFGGSGSTLIACEQTSRTCYMCELDEKYVDVIRQRWAKLVYPD